MPATPTPPRRLPRSTVWFLVAAAAIVLGLTAIYARRAGDLAGYLVVGELARTGRDIYRDAPPGINTWPPLFSVACIPLALLARISVVATRACWILLNWGALLFALAASIRMAWGRPLVLAGWSRKPSDGIELPSTAALLPLLLTIRWILSNFEHLQVNLIILALTLAGLLCHRERRDGRAGLLIGAAAALKVLPVIFVPYFLWRRQWRAMAWTAVATIGWSLIPALVYGPARYREQFTTWLDFFRRGQGVGKMNLSVYAMVDRIVGHRLVPFAVPGIDDLAPSGSSMVKILVIGALVIVTAMACWWFRGEYDPRSRRAAAEWSITLLVGAVFSPLTWKPYLVVLLVPMVLFVATWRDDNVAPQFRRRLRAMTWLIFAIGLLAADLLVGPRLAWRLEMGSLPTMMALVALGTLFWYHARIGPATTAR